MTKFSDSTLSIDSKSLPVKRFVSASPSVLFLDVDGVLQTPAADDWKEMEHCEGLIAVLSQLPQLSIVVISNYSGEGTLDSVRQHFPEEISQRIIDITPVTALSQARKGRQVEIELWLDHHPDVKNWVAVDDEKFLYKDYCPWLVMTHKWLGWTEQTTETVMFLLRRGTPLEAIELPAPGEDSPQTWPVPLMEEPAAPVPRARVSNEGSDYGYKVTTPVPLTPNLGGQPVLRSPENRNRVSQKLPMPKPAKLSFMQKIKGMLSRDSI